MYARPIPSAVDREGPYRRRRHLRRDGVPAERHGRLDRGLAFLRQVRRHVAVHEPGRDHVGGDAARAEFAGQRPGQADQAGLGRGVVGLAGRAVQAHHGGDEDEAAPAHPHHAAYRPLGHPVRADQVRVEYLGEVVLAHQRQQRVPGHARVGDQHLHRPLVRFHRGEGGVDRRRVAHVTLDHRQPVHRVAGTGGHGDTVAVGREPPRDGQPDTAVPAGHEHGTPHVHLPGGCWRGSSPGLGVVDSRRVNDRQSRIDPEFTALPLRELADAALAQASSLGAQHADFRAERIRGQQIGLSDGNPQTLFDADDTGLAVRVIVDGTWGFASAVDLTADAAAQAARQAVEVARVAAAMNTEPIELAPEPAVRRGELGVGVRHRPVHGQRGGQGGAAGAVEPRPARAPRRQPRGRLAAAGAGSASSTPTAPPRRRSSGSGCTRRSPPSRWPTTAGSTPCGRWPRRPAGAMSSSPAPAGTSPPSWPSCPTCSRPSCGPVGRARPLRPGHRPVQPLAHHPRVDRARHRAGPGARLRGRLRRHVVRHPGQARQPAVRLAAS